MSAASVDLVYRSHLAAPADVVWARAMTLSGINAEAMPVFSMRTAPGVSGLADVDFEPGTMLFRADVLAFGLIRYDWTELTLIEFEPGRRFVERSPMGSMHSWQHIRTVEPSGTGCILTDELRFEPKWPRLLARTMVAVAFRNRHRQLRRHHGQQLEVARA